MSFDFKAAIADTSLPSNGFFLGADSQAATNPSIYSVPTVVSALFGNISANLTFTADNTFDIGVDGSSRVRRIFVTDYIKVKDDNNAGSYFRVGSGNLDFYDNGGSRKVLFGGDAVGVRFTSDWTMQWSSTTSEAYNSVDAGLGRAGTNTLKVTDGSSGTGKLIFIVPTADPHIVGALWNNAGTLTISAG